MREVGEASPVLNLAIAAVLLAVGTVLRAFAPQVGGITPNLLIFGYCLAVIMIHPVGITGLISSFGIGFVAALLSMLTSKSPIPYLNLVSEPVGAVVTFLLVSAVLTYRNTFAQRSLLPAIVTFGGTFASGFTYITVYKLIASLPAEVYLYQMMPVVLVTGCINAVLAFMVAPATLWFYDKYLA